jgi:hypothetical protein
MDGNLRPAVVSQGDGRGGNETMWVAHRNNGSNDERVVVAQHNIVCALEADPKLGFMVFLCMLQCTTCEK